MDKKILVIEDDENILANLVALLTENGFHVLKAENGFDGLTIAQMEIPDLVICDIMMPGLDGYDVLKEFLNNVSLKSIPFIFLTAKAELKSMRQGMDMGADDYLIKPYKASDVLNSINSRLKRIEIFKASFAKSTEKIAPKKYTMIDKFFLKVNGKPQFIRIDHILYLSSERQYTSIHLMSGRSFLVRKSITSFESMLPDNNFIRIHRSTIINLNFIEKIEKCNNSSIKIYITDCEKPFIASKRYSSKLRKNLI